MRRNEIDTWTVEVDGIELEETADCYRDWTGADLVARGWGGIDEASGRACTAVQLDHTPADDRRDYRCSRPYRGLQDMKPQEGCTVEFIFEITATPGVQADTRPPSPMKTVIDAVLDGFDDMVDLEPQEQEIALAGLPPVVAKRIRQMLRADRAKSPFDTADACPRTETKPVSLSGTISRYEVDGVLGRGGAGVVHRATLNGPGDTRIPVALKILHEGSEEIRREARIGGLLRHQNLVDVYEIGEVHGTWFCAMELCESSLFTHGPFPVRAVIEIGLSVCAALQYAHEELGLVHLDLKPQNLLHAAGVVKVADLGIAQAQGFQIDGIRGTPGFMAPEQWSGGPVDARTDVYGLGRTLSALLGSEGTAGEQPSEPSGHRGLDEVIARCLSPEPEARYPSMAQLARDLGGLTISGPGLLDALALDSPPVHPAPDQEGTNLQDPGPMYGRGALLQRLAELLANPCLVVLKGGAGIGKTHLGTAAARQWRSKTGGEAWLCDLRSASTVTDLVVEVARTLGIAMSGSTPEALILAVGEALASRPSILVVLDNFEQLTQATGALATWRRLAPDTRFLMTSRRGCGIDGEILVEVEGLGKAASRELLVTRALGRGVAVADDPDLDALSTKLEGHPLAMELAAGRLGVLSVRDVLDRLSLSLLRAGGDSHHDALRTALDRSWELLHRAEREALAQLSIFRGGFTMALAEEVLRVDATPLDVVGSLLNRSLIRSEPGRFRMLVGVQEYAAERLAGGDAVRRRHAQAMLRLAESAAWQQFRAKGEGPLRDEFDNLSAACRWAIDAQDAPIAVRTYRAIWRVLQVLGPYRPAVGLADEVLGIPGLSSDQRCWVLTNKADALTLVAEPDTAHATYEEAMHWAEASGSEANVEVVQHNLAFLHMRMGRHAEAGAQFQVLLEQARARQDVPNESRALINIAQAREWLGELETTRDALDLALKCAQQAKDRLLESKALSDYANMCERLGDLDQAEQHANLALALHRSMDHRRAESLVLGILGRIHHRRGHLELAEVTYRDGMAIQEALGDNLFVSMFAGNLGRVVEQRGQLGEAESLLNKAIACAASVQHTPLECTWQAHIARMRATAGHSDAEQRARGVLARARDSGQPGMLAEVLACVAEVVATTGAPGAQELLNEAAAVAPTHDTHAQEIVAKARERIAAHLAIPRVT